MPVHQERLLLKNAPWKEIEARIASTLGAVPKEGTVQQKTDSLVSTVREAVYALTPQGAAVAVRQKMVDNRPHAAAAHLYALEESRTRGTPEPGEGQMNWKNGRRQLQSSTTIPSGNKRRGTGTSSWRTMITSGRQRKYLKSGDASAFGKIPQLTRADGMYDQTTKNRRRSCLPSSSLSTGQYRR